MRIIRDFEDKFDMLVMRGQIQIIGLRDIVNRIKKYAEHTQSEEFKSAIHQIEEKIDPILGMLSNIPNPESFEFTHVYCFQLREKFRWKTVEWEYGTENRVATQSKEMSNYAQILANAVNSQRIPYVEAIKRIGIERVKALGIEIAGIPLISTTDDSNCPQRKVGEYYIRMGLAPGDMRSRLKQIAERLGILLYAELFP